MRLRARSWDLPDCIPDMRPDVSEIGGATRISRHAYSLDGCRTNPRGVPVCTTVAQWHRDIPGNGAPITNPYHGSQRKMLIGLRIHRWHGDCYMPCRESMTARREVTCDDRRRIVCRVWSRESKGSSFKLDTPAAGDCGRALAERETAATLRNLRCVFGHHLLRLSSKPAGKPSGAGPGPEVLSAHARDTGSQCPLPAKCRPSERCAAHRCLTSGFGRFEDLHGPLRQPGNQPSWPIVYVTDPRRFSETGRIDGCDGTRSDAAYCPAARGHAPPAPSPE